MLPRLTAALAAAALIAGCGEKGEPDEPTPGPGPGVEQPVVEGDGPRPGDDGPRNPGRPDGVGGAGVEGGPEITDPAAGQPDVSPSSGAPDRRREATALVRRYFAALNAGDGSACALFVPGALADFRFPEQRGGCAASLNASIGYEDPRGLPVWESVRAQDFRSVRVGTVRATVIVTALTRFADRDQPSIEDDIVYLTRAGGGWLISRPDAALHRAVGREPPLGVLTPPDP